MQFWLGTHQVDWLGKTDVPLMVSHRRLAKRATLPRARGPWVLDSGAFSEIAEHGRFTTTPMAYALAVTRYQEEIGGLQWCAPQDWMCEPHMLKRTGMTVLQHQKLTIDSYLRLRDAGILVIPVLQGWLYDDYLRHAEAYGHEGVDLAALPVVGLGSVCRRQHTDSIVALIGALQPLRLHGFGMKSAGISRAAYGLASADSMAWSYNARRARPLSGCMHQSCANCLRYALWWRERVLVSCNGAEQATFDLGGAA